MDKENTKTVLIADDEERILILLQANLEIAGYQVVVAHDGNEALALLEEQAVDAVITDMNMPGAGGLQVIDAVRAKYGVRLPVIVITAYGSVHNAVEAMHRGATDYIEKPFDMSDLRVCLQKWLEIADDPSHQFDNG